MSPEMTDLIFFPAMRGGNLSEAILKEIGLSITKSCGAPLAPAAFG